MTAKPTLLLLLSLLSLRALAQDDDMMQLIGEEKPAKEYVYNAFKSSRVIMSHSMEMLRPGVLDFRILHRFGNVNRGIGEFFGLDQASIRLGLDYGISNNLTVGIGRGSYRKELDGFLKYRAIQQATGPKASPVSLLAVGGITVFTTPWSDLTRENHFSSRVGYYGQVIVGRKFNERFTLQLMPTMLHRNLVATVNDPQDLFATGIGGRVKLNKRISLNVDYYYVFNPNDKASVKTYNPLSIGFDIETGGHVFQLHFTNAIGMNEKTFLTETTNNWGNGDFQFGFNISRAFQLKKKKTG